MVGRLRLAMVVDSNAFGGAEAYARQLLHRAPAGVDPTLLVAAPVAPYFAPPYFAPTSPAKVIPLGLDAERAPALASALAEVGPDVVHVNLVNPASNRAALRAAQACAPTVATLHDGGTSPGLRELYSNLAAAVAVSAKIARQLRDDLGVPASAIHRIRNGVDLPPRVAHPADRYPLVVGAVGQLAYHKGFDLFVEAVSRLNRRGRRLRVVIAGQGPARDRLEREARGLPITLLGLCRDIPALLRRLDVFCLPSRREGLSLALLEAMAHGLPCVTTAVGDIAEAVGSDALVVPPGDVDGLVIALDRLLDDPALRRELGPAGTAAGAA
jgi:glycosyltransferase involved in cell wall biosynthesis